MIIESKEITEKALIAALKLGNEAAFKRFFDTYSSLVFNVSLSFLPIKEDAEEILQDVFVEAYKSIEKFRGDASLKTWVYRIAIMKSLERIRYNKRKKRWAIFVSLDIEISEPSTDVEDNSKAKVLRQQMETLSEKQKTAFTLHHIEGLSYFEVSNIMDTSLSSVESLIFRAKANLKKNITIYYQKNHG